MTRITLTLTENRWHRMKQIAVIAAVSILEQQTATNLQDATVAELAQDIFEEMTGLRETIDFMR